MTKKEKEKRMPTKRRLLAWSLVFLVIGIAGALFQHYVVEPFIGQNIQALLDKCYSDMNMLNNENIACIKDKEITTKKSIECDQKLEKAYVEYNDTLSKLIECKKELKQK